MFAFLLITVFVASLNSVLLHKLPKKSDVFTFNFICSVIWFVVLFAVNGFSITFSKEIVFWGILYGIVQMFFLTFKTKAMGSGPVSITTLIGNCSLLLSTVAGIIVWKESISWMQILGIAMLIVAFFLCTFSKSQDSKSKIWVFYCVFFFVCAAGVGIIFKGYSKSLVDAEERANDMMIIASIVMMILFAGKKGFNMLLARKKNEEIKELSYDRTYLWIALASGVLSCAYNRLNVVLAGKFPAAVFYPCFNGGVILLSLILSFILLKERLTLRQTTGLMIGTTAVLVIGLF